MIIREYMPPYDVVIKSHPKDYVKLKYVIGSLVYLTPQPEGIYLISPDGFVPRGCERDKRIVSVRDDELFPNTDKNRFKYRPNWCFVSFISMFQDITKNDFYLDANSDNIFKNELNLFDESGKPFLFMSPQHSHHSQPYYTFNELMMGLSKVAEDSFIMEFMMYNKKVSREILDTVGGFDNFFNKSCEIIDKDCHIADQELYSNWCLAKHPDMYAIKKGIQTLIDGKQYPLSYTSLELEALIDAYKGDPDLTAISYHTWLPLI